MYRMRLLLSCLLLLVSVACQTDVRHNANKAVIAPANPDAYCEALAASKAEKQDPSVQGKERKKLAREFYKECLEKLSDKEDEPFFREEL